jgi:hypothetical protein
MSAVARLETLVEVDDYDDARTTSVSARLEAVLADGRRFVLLDDRGWSGSLNRLFDIEETARAVVGPDEPFDGRSQEHMEATHWAFISEVLRQQGVVVGAQELQRLSHDVVIGERLQARIGLASRPPSD